MPFPSSFPPADVGLRALYPWVTVPIPKKAAWLNVPFFVLRTIVGVGALYWVSVRFAKAVHRSPAGASEEPGKAERASLAVGFSSCSSSSARCSATT